MEKLSILLLSVIIFSCNSVMKKQEKQKLETEFTIQKKGLPLNNQWIIEHFNSPKFEVLIKDSYITIPEDMKSFSGKGGCNNIGGELIVKENLIKFDKVFATRMHCMETMNQENLFIKNLNETNNYKIIGGELFLYKDKELLMTLESFR